MKQILFQYRGRNLNNQDIVFITSCIDKYYSKGRSYISRLLCKEWNWRQPNGGLKEYAARDLLLRLEENNLIKLPPRLRPKNNLKQKSFDQIPFFYKQDYIGNLRDYQEPIITLVESKNSYLWDYLIHHYHYLGLQTLVGEYVKHLVFINDHVVACLGWSSASWKIKSRDQFISWDEAAKKKNLYFIANNSRFLILPWIRVKHLASKILSKVLKQLSDDWQRKYNHPLYLVETFVDTSRFKGICYQASNWRYVGQSKGSSKKGNKYVYHGQSKAIYLYPLHRHFRRLLSHDQG